MSKTLPTLPLTGGCSCGAIRYEVTSFPLLLYTCNCTDCQTPSGSVVASGVTLSGITWDVWATGGNGYLAFVPRSTLPSGSLDLKAMIDSIRKDTHADVILYSTFPPNPNRASCRLLAE